MNGGDDALLFPWGVNDLNQRGDTYDKMADDHVPTDKCARKLPSSRFPGRMCDKCALNRSMWMFWLAPLRSALKGAAKSIATLTNGACLTLIWEGVRYFYDLVLILDRPGSYLALRIKQISAFRPGKSVRFGGFEHPSPFKIQRDDVYDGTSCCIL